MQRGLLLMVSAVLFVAAMALLMWAGLPQRAAFTGIITAPDARPIAPELNAYAPPFTRPTLTGESLSLEALRGSPVVVNFWATWCAPCAYEMPELQRLYETYADEGLRVVAVNLGESREAIDTWVNGFGLTFDIVLDANREVETLYFLRGQPSTYIISPSGVITHIFYGAANMEALENALSPYLTG